MTAIVALCCVALRQTRGSGSLVIAAFLDFLTFALCTPYSETTDAADFDSILQLIADSGRVVFKLFQVQCGHKPYSRQKRLDSAATTYHLIFLEYIHYYCFSCAVPRRAASVDGHRERRGPRDEGHHRGGRSRTRHADAGVGAQ